MSAEAAVKFVTETPVEEIERVKAAFVQRHPHLDSFIRKDDMTVVCVQVDFFLLLDGPERAYHEILDKPQPMK